MKPKLFIKIGTGSSVYLKMGRKMARDRLYMGMGLTLKASSEMISLLEGEEYHIVMKGASQLTKGNSKMD